MDTYNASSTSLPLCHKQLTVLIPIKQWHSKFVTHFAHGYYPFLIQNNTVLWPLCCCYTEVCFSKQTLCYSEGVAPDLTGNVTGPSLCMKKKRPFIHNVLYLLLGALITNLAHFCYIHNYYTNFLSQLLHG